ncbi:uncharacterized protein At5g48480 [Punica granatum]|uniref:VOC domain-containing protein n=2 Tax=Punica granatum TaxID=22663 RepID=A0A218VQE2_PUNGR|nr:uncharacterized protein At5g48480 [Punica granatum]OWM62747.1 hypothetical protein CDL15_Pgr020041 [Punica granatum]PKI59161.1 hypothetical protein CRG98_020426 [Punica granatum]
MAQQVEVQNGGGAAEAKAVSVTAVKPQLFVEAPKASDAISFYKAAFGAEEVSRSLHPKRKADQELPLILSAQLLLAGTTILISDASDDSAPAAKTAGAGIVLCLETNDIDAAVSKAVSAGAVSEGELEETEGACCGGRVGKVKDPYGFTWHICSAAAAACQEPADVEA